MIKRDKGMQDFLDRAAIALFGRKQDDKHCIGCGAEVKIPDDFKDSISIKEFRITGMCQKCQDSMGMYEE